VNVAADWTRLIPAVVQAAALVLGEDNLVKPVIVVLPVDTGPVILSALVAFVKVKLELPLELPSS
jgi:hypothetical protein